MNNNKYNQLSPHFVEHLSFIWFRLPHLPPGTGDGETKSSSVFPSWIIRRRLLVLGKNTFVKKVSEKIRMILVYISRWLSWMLRQLWRLLILRLGCSVPCFHQMISVNLVFHQGRQSVKDTRQDMASLVLGRCDWVLESSLDRLTWQLLLRLREHVRMPWVSMLAGRGYRCLF